MNHPASRSARWGVAVRRTGSLASRPPASVSGQREAEDFEARASRLILERLPAQAPAAEGSRPGAGRSSPLDTGMPLLVAVRDLFFRSKIDEAARRLGVTFQYAPLDLPLEEAVQALGPGTVLVDLNVPEAFDALRAARAAGARTIGYLGHLQLDLAEAATDAGAEVLTRGQLAARLEPLLREVGAPPAAAQP